MKTTDLESELEHLQEQLGKELESRTHLEEKLNDAEEILASMAKAIKKYRNKYYGGKS